MIGDIMELKVACLNNEAGTKGFIFYDYGDGFQVIFPNGNYDGFSTVSKMPNLVIEADYFLEKVGHDPRFADYQFENVMIVSNDYRKGYWKF